MSLTPEERVLLAPEEVLEGDRASLITGMAIARAWRDPGFRDRLLSNPRAVLADDGLEIPDGMEIRVFEDSPEIKHVGITKWTSEPGELATVFEGVLPLPEGCEVRLVQNSDQAVCLIIPVAVPELETITDPDRLRRFAPRASIFASAESVAAQEAVSSAEAEMASSAVAVSVATEFGTSGSASASATAHAATETETATATAEASGTASGVVSATMNDPGCAPGSGTPGSGAPGSGSPGSGSPLTLVLLGGSGSPSAAISGGGDESAVSTNTNQVTNTSVWVETFVDAVAQVEGAVTAVELQTVGTTTTAAAEAEVVAVAVIVVT